MSDYQERRQWIKKLQDYMDGPNCGMCPVCRTNTEMLVDHYERKIDRLRGALTMIAGQENSMLTIEGERSLYLDADEKMRKIARAALDGEGWLDEGSE